MSEYPHICTASTEGLRTTLSSTSNQDLRGKQTSKVTLHFDSLGHWNQGFVCQGGGQYAQLQCPDPGFHYWSSQSRNPQTIGGAYRSPRGRDESGKKLFTGNRCFSHQNAIKEG